MAQEWNIRTRGHVCSVCGKPLINRSLVVSALHSVNNTWERLDCHPECWKAMERDWEPFSLWDGVYLEPVKEERKEPLKKEDAGELLRRLITLDDPAMRNVVYVLAVMLERSKILVERDSKMLEDNTIRRVYEDRKNGDTFVIIDPRLRMENLSEVQQQVVSLLSGTKSLGEVAQEESSSTNKTPDRDEDESVATQGA